MRNTMSRIVTGTLLIAIAGGAHAATPAGRAGKGPTSAFQKFCQTYWDENLAANPVAATALGIKTYDDRLDDNSPAGIAKDRARLERTLARARAFDEAGLSAEDRLSRRALIEELESGLARMDCAFHEWVVDPLNGPQVEFMNLADYTVFESPRDAANYAKRVRAMGPYVDQHVANLRLGLAAGKTASRAAVEKTIVQLDELMAKPAAEWAVSAPAKAEHKAWSAGERTKFATDLAAAVDQSLAPALRRYREFLGKDVTPAARPAEKAGMAALPAGVECYRKMIRAHTSLDLDPQTIHQMGLDAVARFRRELSELGARALGTSDVQEIQKRLRTDPAMQFATAGEVEGKAREALARAKAAIPQWFGILPRADCDVKVMGMHEAPYSTIAYYRQPAADGSRPGTYMINTYKPETRPRYEAEALAFHESIPGHHLQIAIAQELRDVPEFRKHQGVTSFVEGWALYTERLADEMGLYSSDVDRIGMLSYDAWRACRLVVDTGVHALGWSRQQAIDYMIENSVLAENNIVNEVDRYLTWPGQALAYKLGQLEILRLRDEARARLGDRFDIRAFHDVVLRDGAVALPVLRANVVAWMTAQAAAK
jgi:uncharacterized protein (DUF885 family)